jgi:ArsR family transcriptional regulator, arsenate/arsenite/antimonite-responsive transcriptional repressor
MGSTKTDLFTEEQNQMANLAKAIGHPARVAIIEYLLKVQGCICNDIVNEINLAQPTVSQHLRELKNVGIIKGSIEGNAICYCINNEVFDTIKGFFKLENNIKNNCC